VYGDAGDDALFGSTTTANEYLLGGAGSDYIRGGNTGMESDIFGGDGDDFIRRGDGITVSSTVNAGKGDDTVG